MADVSLNLEHSQQMKQMQRLMMSAKMQQAIQLLQTPAMELSALIEMQLEQNPVLTTLQDESEELDGLEESEKEGEDAPDALEQPLFFDENDFSVLKELDNEFYDQTSDGKSAPSDQYMSFAEQSILSVPTLFEHLMQQAGEIFDAPEDLAMAEALIGEFTPEGYLQTPMKEIAQRGKFTEEALKKVLKRIQTFDPRGVGASTLQECMLIQLRCKGKEGTLEYQIVDKHYDDLLHNNIRVIAKDLNVAAEEVAEVIQMKLCLLDLHPGLSYFSQTAPIVVPDVELRRDGEEWMVTINEDYMPSLRLNGKYMRLMEDQSVSADTKDYIRKQITSAKWLVRNIHQRNQTLIKIVQNLCKRQTKFFEEPDGKLVPLTMKVIAEDLGMHESTVARAISNKYLESPRGLLALRKFFSNALETTEGDISSKTVRELLLDMIKHEDKKHPLSDEELSNLLQKRGVECARRTVAKYRSELNLGNAHQRRRF